MPAPHRHRQPWREVELVPGETPCPAARALVGRGFAFARAPRLPLLECPWADDCDCRLGNHDARRPREAGGAQPAPRRSRPGG